LFPIQHIVEAETAAPLALLREIAMVFWTVDPEQTAAVIDEMTASTLRDLRHGRTSDNPVFPA
jgi:hypothetical protein